MTVKAKFYVQSVAEQFQAGQYVMITLEPVPFEPAK